VDEDPGAVEIAKLRLWLSMVVDESEIGHIQPLPNLDYKIMQGNSLLEEFPGIPLFDERLLHQELDEGPDPRLAKLEERQRWVEQEILRLQAAGKLTRQMSVKLKDEAARLSRERKMVLNPPARSEAGHPEFGFGSRGGLKRLQELHADFFDEASRAKKEKLRAELERLEWDFMRATLREQKKERALLELERASAKHRKPFFLWRLHFAEVFHEGGFDVVIGNPPYVRIQEIKKLNRDMPTLLKRRFRSASRVTMTYMWYSLKKRSIS
jgi:adenine-specific DNA-methyltransferase